MSSKKRNMGTTTDNLPALRIGSRVRCSEDGVEGRITWANGIAVKIQWDDGEQVTWRRDSLASRPIDILDRAGEEGPSSTIAAAAEGEQAIPAETPPTEPTTTPRLPKRPRRKRRRPAPPSLRPRQKRSSAPSMLRRGCWQKKASR